VRDEGLDEWYDFVRSKAGRSRRFRFRA
jgi:hypothetical protein